MATRTYLIPKIGTGTRLDPYRPDMPLPRSHEEHEAWKAAGWRGANTMSAKDLDFFFVEADATDAILDALAVQPGVEEIPDTDVALPARTKAATRAVYAGKLAMPEVATGRQLRAELRLSVMAAQTVSGYKPEDRDGLADRIAAHLALQRGR